MATPLAVVVLATAAWGVDTAAGGDVVRNVEVAGRSVGGDDRDELRAAIEAYQSDIAGRGVRLLTPQGELPPTTVGDLGLTVDIDATVERVLDAGRSPAILRPVRWVTSFVSPHDVDPVLSVNIDAVYQTIVGLEGDRRVPPVEPTIAVEDGEVVLVPSVPGSGIDVHEVAERLPDEVLSGADPIVLTLDPIPLPPATSDEQVQAVAEEANLITDVPLTVAVAGQTAEVSSERQRSWLQMTDALELTIDEEAAIDDLADLFPELGSPPVDASVTLGEDGVPVVVPGQDGTGCCLEGSGAQLLAAMEDGSGSVSLDTAPRPPELTTQEVEAWAIREAVGGTRAWPVSRSDEVGAGFTTFHQCCESRVTNIHRIADIVRGAVIPPGGEFSINDYVGRRTTENGFVAAGAIRNGEHVSEVGGGVSQFATTTFNAAYFAGLDILDYQAHSEYFSRYPRGREATMGYPAPDLRIKNTTPFGILIWTSYTDTSLTITLYSSPFVLAEQTGIEEHASGNCTVVTTERTRTYPDGSTDVDHFRAIYRPGAGQFC